MSTVRVYFNGRGIDAPSDATVLDALQLWDPAAAAEVQGGTRALADSRGLAADPASIVHGGAIFRLVSARSRGTAAE